MTVTIKLELNTAVAEARLQDLVGRMDQREPFFRAVGDMLLRSVSENFRKQRGPDDVPWTPLKPATIRARQRKKQLPLEILRSNSKGKSGSSLAGSVRQQVSNDILRVGSPVAYAAIHQLGGTINKPASSRWMAGRRFAKRELHPDGKVVAIAAHKIVIPARPFIGVSATDQKNILELAENWLAR